MMAVLIVLTMMAIVALISIAKNINDGR